MPDTLFELPGFTLVRADRDANSGKTKGGGICVYINDLWCRSHAVKYKICDNNVEILGMMLRPFYLPREFGSILLFVVYSPPSGKAAQAARTIADCGMTHIRKMSGLALLHWQCGRDKRLSFKFPLHTIG